jgi:MtN3 and saliva related transmembrane protein
MHDSSIIMTTTIGWIAGTGTTISFFPQVYHVLVRSEKPAVSLPMLCIHCTGVVAWILYGVLRQDMVIIVFNAITVVCLLILFYAMYRWRERDVVVNVGIDNDA